MIFSTIVKGYVRPVSSVRQCWGRINRCKRKWRSLLTRKEILQTDPQSSFDNEIFFFFSSVHIWSNQSKPCHVVYSFILDRLDNDHLMTERRCWAKANGNEFDVVFFSFLFRSDIWTDDENKVDSLISKIIASSLANAMMFTQVVEHSTSSSSVDPLTFSSISLRMREIAPHLFIEHVSKCNWCGRSS